VEFDTGALLRSAQKDRIDSLARGVQGGIYAPNEAREMEGLEAVPFGDEPRVQQQVVPLSQVGKIPAAPAPGAPPPAPTDQPKPADQPKPPQKASRDDIHREVGNIFANADRIGRRRMSA
jgi:hypothetical protein